MKEFKFKTIINSKFYLSSDIYKEQVSKVWIVFHGYGQLAKFFLKKFETLFSQKYLFIAPQGLHQFYLNGFSGRIGSSWMTSNDRDDQIENYLIYLSKLEQLLLELDSSVELNVLGFSQGGNTMSRFLESSKLKFNKIVFWGSEFANDINHSKFFENYQHSNFIICYGNQDQFISNDKVIKLKNIFNQYDFKPETIVFQGGHEICIDTFKKIF
jgi:predicted esterase